MAEFVLDPRIAQSSHHVADLPLCQVRLQDDGRFVWLVLIPRMEGLRELSDLTRSDRIRLLDEIDRAAAAVLDLAQAQGAPVDKLNIANLGNVVAQLHWHVVGRRADDSCWPGPVWGQGRPSALAADALDQARKRLRLFLSPANN